MSLSSCTLWRWATALLVPISLLFAPQPAQAQFAQPVVVQTTGEVVGISAGDTQLQGRDDLLYVEKATAANTVNAGLLLNTGSAFTNLPQNQTTFQNVTGVVSTIADMDGDGIPDFIFATSPATSHSAELCVFFGTKAAATSGAYAKDRSGCTLLPLMGSIAPVFTSIAAAGFTSGTRPQIFLADSDNGALYVISNAGATGDGTSLAGYSLQATYPLGAGGAGPIVVGDFNRDGRTDLILNGQAGNTAAVYLGKGDGTFATPSSVGQSVHSMLVADVDGDGAPDLIAEDTQGNIRIYKGHADGSFDSTSEGGGTDAAGGTLVAVAPGSLDLLVAAPAGLSVLKKHPGTLDYAQAAIYNIGPGRSAFALEDFFHTGSVELAAGSPEGVAVVSADAQGGFSTSRAFATIAPPSGVAVAKFRGGSPLNDIATAVGGGQSELLLNKGDGTFAASSPAPTSQTPGAARIQAGTFTKDGAGLLFSGNGASADGAKLALAPHALTASGDTTATALPGATRDPSIPGNTVVADLNGDGMDDIAVTDATNTETLLNQPDGSFRIGFRIASKNSSAGQIAAGFFKGGRTSRQDLVVQQGEAVVPYRNSGNGEQFTAMQPLSATPAASALTPAAIRMADLDSDGNGDVIVLYRSPDASTPNQLYLWFGNGDGSFGQPQIVPLSRHFTLAAIGDMNTDGHPDVVLADDSVVAILYNQGGRSFHSDFGTGCSPCAEQHLLAGAAIRDITLGDVNGDGAPDLVVANGSTAAAQPVAQTRLASTTSTAQPRLGGGVTVVPHLGSSVVSGSITVNPEPSAVGGPFTIYLEITPPTGSSAVPTGTVQFSIGGQTIGGAVTVNPDPISTNNSATAFITGSSSSTTPPGTYSITASYSGDSNYAPNGFTSSHNIGAPNTTTTLALCVGPTPSCPSSGPVTPPYVPALTMVYGQTVNGFATVTAGDRGFLSGTTSFLDNGVVVCTYATVGGQCPTNPLTNLATGQHNLVAQYSGDATHTGSTSPAVTINVSPDSTTTTLTGGPNPAVQGTPVTFTITVTGQSAAPTGTFTFANGSTALGTATLRPSGATTSTATFTTSSLPVGTDQVIANYGGNQNFLPSSSGSFAETITAPGTPGFQLTVGPTPLRVAVGTTGQLAVTITSVNGFSGPVNLSCGPMPSEATCTFGSPIINGSGTTSLLISTTAPHDCNNSQPYFIGLSGGGGMSGLALPALAGMFALFLPGRRRWIRGLLMLLLTVGAMSASGCGNCTDLATRPGAYSFTVNATTTGGSGQSQTVALTVYI